MKEETETDENSVSKTFENPSQSNQNVVWDPIKSSYIFTDPQDGSLYEWNQQHSAWYPFVPENVLQSYQLAYGENAAQSENLLVAEKAGLEKKEEESVKRRKVNVSNSRKNTKNLPETSNGWKEISSEQNSNVYVENLPKNITLEEFADFMKKAGIIKEDVFTHQLKLKLYREKDGNELKGDGLCTYLKVESVPLALQILDGTEIKPGFCVKISQAKFQPKENFQKSKPKLASGNSAKRKGQTKLLGWADENPLGIKQKYFSIVVFKNMFTLNDVAENVTILEEIKQDVLEECLKFGEIKKILIFETHPDGVISVQFVENESATKCISVMNGRWFGGRQIQAEHWDGVTKYKVEESVEMASKRVSHWENWLEKD